MNLLRVMPSFHLMEEIAVMEASVTMAMVHNNFDVRLSGSHDDVGMKTIQSMNGINMHISKR